MIIVWTSDEWVGEDKIICSIVHYVYIEAHAHKTIEEKKNKSKNQNRKILWHAAKLK